MLCSVSQRFARSLSGRRPGSVLFCSAVLCCAVLCSAPLREVLNSGHSGRLWSTHLSTIQGPFRSLSQSQSWSAISRPISAPRQLPLRLTDRLTDCLHCVCCAALDKRADTSIDVRAPSTSLPPLPPPPPHRRSRSHRALAPSPDCPQSSITSDLPEASPLRHSLLALASSTLLLLSTAGDPFPVWRSPLPTLL